MSKIVNKLLLAGDKFMTEMYLRPTRFTYSAFGPFTKNKETEDSRYIYQNELDKACFQHDIAYEDFKNLTRRTASDEILRYKAFDTVKYPNYDGSQRGLVSIVF